MDWIFSLLILLGGLLFLLLLGVRVAFAFFIVNFIFVMIIFDPASGAKLMIASIYDSVTKYVLVPVLLFVLMGEFLFNSGLATRALDALSKIMGNVPGRLSILANLGGALLGMLSGSTMASTAILSRLLVPEMQKRNYNATMIAGPIIASGGLAMLIPPSAVAVILGSIAEINIARLLIGGIIPGLLMAFFYFMYILIRCIRNPSLTPIYEFTPSPFKEKLFIFLIDILPLGILIFLVTGLIILGVATPTEAGAAGALGAFLMAFIYNFNYQFIVKSIKGTLLVTCMALIVISGSTGFSQLIAFSGAGRGLVSFITQLQTHPLLILIFMQIIVIILGMFLDQMSTIMISMPIFMPIVHSLGFDLVWFGVLILISLQIGLTTPPFGLNLFVMRGSLPPDSQISIGTIYKSAFPYIICDLTSIILIICFPPIVLWLPSLMK